MVSKRPKLKKEKILSFQDTIFSLQKFWAKQGCIILQPYDVEVGAGTFHPATTLRSLGKKPWKTAYVQPSRRPTDGRYGENPNRLQHYYQFQVLIKPSPKNIKKLYLNSIASIGIKHEEHDIRFVEDDWESPTLGAAGLGWEVWCDGMEVTQFTYFQQMAGVECDPISVEITYGLERLCMFTQNKKNGHRSTEKCRMGRGAYTIPGKDCDCRVQTIPHHTLAPILACGGLRITPKLGQSWEWVVRCSKF